jgi:hypothetical protein
VSAAMPRLTVLFGIPTDVSEFSARAAASDYLRKYVDSTVEDSGEQLRTAWEDEYRPIVTEPLQDLIRAAQRVGGSVRRGATLADVAAATEAYDIVVILSHWKGPELANDDFTAALDGRLFVDRLRLADGPVGRWLAQAFTANGISEASEPLATRAKRKWWSWFARSKPKTVL